MSEINLYGVYVPILLLHAALAYLVFTFSNRWVDRLNHQGWILYPNIFYLCWYFVCLSAVHYLYLFCFSM